MIAVIKTGGKQYKVSPKDKIRVEKLEGAEGEKIVFDQVLLISSEDAKDVNFGAPVIENAKVEATILHQARGKKVEIVKHKAKKRYNVKRGHRQYYTEVEILSIVA